MWNNPRRSPNATSAPTAAPNDQSDMIQGSMTTTMTGSASDYSRRSTRRGVKADYELTVRTVLAEKLSLEISAVVITSSTATQVDASTYNVAVNFNVYTGTADASVTAALKSSLTTFL